MTRFCKRAPNRDFRNITETGERKEKKIIKKLSVSSQEKEEVNNSKRINESVEEQKVDEETVAESMIMTCVNDDGTTSNYFDKRKLKIAPRSTLQFKIGPPFELFRKYYKIYDKTTDKIVDFHMIPRIDRGFDHIDNEWVGYKRNYFTLVSAFGVADYGLKEFLNGSYLLHLQDSFNDERLDVEYFAMIIKARNDDDSNEIPLVQHTAKRDKGPQFSPKICPLIPSHLPQHQIIREASNVRNSVKMKKYDSTFYFHRDREKNQFSKNSLLFSYPKDCIEKVARYERVQFSSSISVKKPSQQNKHFRLHVIFGAVTCLPFINQFERPDSFDKLTMDDGRQGYFIQLQEMRTPPLIIRGRSPSNYTNPKQQHFQSQTSQILYSNGSSKHLSQDLEQGTPTLENHIMVSKANKTKPPKRQKTRKLASPSPLISKPVEFRRPTKRESKVVTLPKNMNKDKKSFPRPHIRVETIENIENRLYAGTSSQLSAAAEIQNLYSNNGSPKLERPNQERHISVDLRDIELKPSYTPLSFPIPMVDKKGTIMDNKNFEIESGPKMLVERDLNKEIKSKRTIQNKNHLPKCRELSREDVTLSNISSFSFLFEKSDVTGKPLAQEKSEISFNVIPRLSAGSSESNNQPFIKDKSMSFEMPRMLLKENMKLNLWNAFNILPSEILSAGNFLEDDSFYNH
ncbi:transcription factor NDT80 NDAI_0B04400 [Naumovozyma dairenensis CBS 421]|uniref:NDT80 domain-containing protein n=1 Tax=Naumovozyma dairenensis (strain ATCC 10597 / BCRC 20456 / CBS 421 / NBRC 0211 / NRRL Y-12639) TaxID=1071378 RepID=G0W6R3_NAUDC|nr:hypothetical protein NDAI_0B04400 [Naumovozyma dairenensis CBS 421]CCD23474.1 hypothetical protein NDAI_0B04400 [Naumovozyma dairenensis CBS 421]